MAFTPVTEEMPGGGAGVEEDGVRAASSGKWGHLLFLPRRLPAPSTQVSMAWGESPRVLCPLRAQVTAPGDGPC